MAYDEKLAERIRVALKGQRGIAEKKMFGGVAFMTGDKMFCGIVKNDLMVRVGAEQNDAALQRPHTRPMDFTGRPMKGYVFVAPAGCKSEAALAEWLRMGSRFVSSLKGAHAKTKPKATGSAARKKKR